MTAQSDTALSDETQRQIAERILAMLINEAAFAVDDHVAAPQDIDLAMQLGLNFPKGSFAFLAEMGIDPCVALLAKLDADAPAHLKGRYQPAAYLRQGAN